MMNLMTEAAEMAPRLRELRRDFHAHPELSGEEVRTAEQIRKELEAIGGYQIRTGVGGHGILAELHGTQPGKTVALRADMDALSIEEKTELSFASVYPGVMHACGHDHHITILLGAARLLRMHQEELFGNVRLIFQPAEEQSPTGGSRRMIEEDALQDAAAVFGLHVWPNLPAGTVGIKSGPLMAASDRFTVHFEGESAHGAMPDQGNDALMAGLQFASAVQTIMSRNKNPMKAGVITIGTFRAGSRYNIVPGSCCMEGTVRTFDPALRIQTEKRMRELFEGIRLAFGLQGELQYMQGYTAVRNAPDMTAYAEKTAEQLLGSTQVIHPEEPAMTAEDFAFYLEKVPGAFLWLGTTPEGEKIWPLHSAHYAGNENVLATGAALLAGLALNFHNR